MFQHLFKPLFLIRLMYLTLAIAINYQAIYILNVYLFVFIVSLEYLNHQNIYIHDQSSQYANIFFVSYFVFIFLVRSHAINDQWFSRFWQNICEHLLFSIFVCMQLHYVLQIFNILSNKTVLKSILIFLIFNILGIINELFQNKFQHLPISTCSADSQKDVLINMIGAFLFLGYVNFWNIAKSVQIKNLIFFKK
ncbi:hypothetical protein [Flavobacterium branchiophilum]|uniref:Transmembrane protein n=1 Tax=Flavobacterium branchiophilum TaxID=55197 RepID=A0A2H3K8E2_9FLAO|nr:hypothetical protein [Flavobacterium branchiophilum]PDS21831.1 hypothetical protein B0A77_14995 [Flavobacterium branchiophilum]